MDKTIKQLPDAELEVMLAIWQQESPVSASEVLEILQPKRSWALQTLLTVMSRLVEKGFLRLEKVGRSNVYHVRISEAEYKEFEGKNILEKLYGNSFKNFVTALYYEKPIQKEELQELKAFLAELEKEE